MALIASTNAAPSRRKSLACHPGQAASLRRPLGPINALITSSRLQGHPHAVAAVDQKARLVLGLGARK